MEGDAPAPSPLAATLLHLAARRADGRMEVGGRMLDLRGGRLLHIAPAQEDRSFAAFLVAAGRLDAAEAQDIDGRAGGDEEQLRDRVAAHLDIPESTVLGLLRSHYLDRLVAGFAAEEATGVGAPSLEPAGDRHGQSFPLTPLVLDALARLAAHGDAGKVGSRADHVMRWLDGPHREEATHWSGLDEAGGRVSRFLMQDPMAAPRIAALVRAHLAKLELPTPSEDLPPPVDDSGSTTPRSSLSPPRAPRMNLEPGRAPEPSLPPAAARRLPSFVAPLEDPLNTLEAEIRRMEREGAGPRDRAQRWCDVARAWQRQLGALSEAARAYREAAAADPSDVSALEQAANLCAALGQADLAHAYARSAATACRPEERPRRLGWLATLEWRAGRTDDARRTWLSAQETAPDDFETARALARLEERRGDLRAAADQFSRAGRLRVEREPAEARALFERALALSPGDDERLRELSRQLVADGEARAAIERVREASELAPPERRLGLFYDAAETAEAESMPLLAADLLLCALAEHPEAEVLYEPLAEDLERAAPGALLACGLEAIASAAPPGERARWLSAAAEATAEDPAGGGVALELYARALEDDPGHEESLRALRRAAETGRNYAMLADALERAGRHGAQRSPEDAAERLLELAELAESRLASTARALWALAKHAELTTPDASTQARRDELAAGDRVAASMVRLAEEEVEAADDAARPAAERRLAGLLRDRPQHHARALSLYTEALSRDSSDASAAEAVLRLLRLSGDGAALKAALSERARLATSRGERIGLRLELASLCVALGDPDSACVAALAILEDSSRHALARGRLEAVIPLLTGPLLKLRALRALVHSAPDPKSKSRALAQLAWEEADPDARLDSALEALELDRDQARAAGALASSLDRMRPERILPLANPLLDVLGDPPPLRRRLAEVAHAAGDHAQREELLGGLLRLGLAPPGVALARLDAARLAGRLDNAASLVEDATAADVLEPGLLDAVEAMVGALAEAGEHVSACGIALRMSDRLGEVGARLLPLAGQLASEAGSTSLRLAVNERLVGREHGDARLEALRRVATLHRETGNRAGEVRALLRILPRDPGDAEALTRLTTLYAESGEQERLAAVLALRSERAGDAVERRERLLDLAEAASLGPDGSASAARYLAEARELGAPEAKASPLELTAAGDPREAVDRLLKQATGRPPEEAEALFRKAVLVAEREAKDPSLALRVAEGGLARAPGSCALLVLFERIALALADVAAAKRVYQRLGELAMGRHGRRALAYRRARWLERAGAATEALEAYTEAFRLSPGDGVVFRGLERLATSCDEPAPLAEALSGLADRCRDVERHIELSTRSARLSADALSDPEAAFERLHSSWLRTGSPGLVPLLRDLARRSAEQDAVAGQAARRALIAGLRKRVDQSWNDADKIRSLLELAAIAGDDGEDHELASSAAREAAELARSSEEVDEELRTAAEMDLARRTHEPKDDAPDPKNDEPKDDDVPAVQPKDDEPPDNDEPKDDDVPAVEPWDTSRYGRNGEVTNEPQATQGTSPNVRPESSRPSASGWFSAPAPPQVVDVPALTGASPETHRLSTLIQECREDPSRAEALLELNRLAASQGRLALTHVTDEILSLFVPEIHAPDSLGAHSVADHLVDPLALVAEQEEVHAPLLRALWEGALPLFRRPLRSFGVLGTQKVSPLAARPLGSAFADGLRLIGPLEVTLYARPSSRREILVAPTHPPAVLVADSLEDDAHHLRFRLGVALDAARPEAVVLTSSPADTGRMILEAARAAFGPAHAQAETARDAASLAADLWRTIPNRQQTSLRRSVAALTEAPNYELARRQILARGARAGLLLCGSLRTALATLPLVDDDLAGASLDSQESYVEVVRSSIAARSLLRMGLSERWLVAVDRNLSR